MNAANLHDPSIGEQMANNPCQRENLKIKLPRLTDGYAAACSLSPIGRMAPATVNEFSP